MNNHMVFHIIPCDTKFNHATSHVISHGNLNFTGMWKKWKSFHITFHTVKWFHIYFQWSSHTFHMMPSSSVMHAWNKWMNEWMNHVYFNTVVLILSNKRLVSMKAVFKYTLYERCIGVTIIAKIILTNHYSFGIKNT